MRTILQRPLTFSWLFRGDALRLKHILHGSIIASQKKIDTSALSTKELSELFDKLGTDIVEEKSRPSDQ